ncbi:MAG TPA: hypothetical protein VMQ76_05345 [Terracidiphilus sp.]|nr:hypothetical protein [Terracidiphilus sp.]
MGKWASYRKRGRDLGTRVPLGPPPPPHLSIVADTIWANAQGLQDTGAKYYTYQSATMNGGYTVADSRDWAPTASFGATGDYYGMWVYLTEVGNGFAYTLNASSDPSNKVFIANPPG